MDGLFGPSIFFICNTFGSTGSLMACHVLFPFVIEQGGKYGAEDDRQGCRNPESHPAKPERDERCGHCKQAAGQLGNVKLYQESIRVHKSLPPFKKMFADGAEANIRQGKYPQAYEAQWLLHFTALVAKELAHGCGVFLPVGLREHVQAFLVKRFGSFKPLIWNHTVFLRD